MEKKTHACKGRQNSYGGRLIKIKPCLSNVPFCMISMFELPKEHVNKFQFYMKRLFW
jgi:hypothetical protein